MFAVIQTGGKQYRVAQNDVLAVERLTGEPGDKVEFDRVLMVAGDGEASVGAATEGARVTAEILEHGRGAKVLIFKKKRRKHHRRRGGHRQDHTVVKITEILAKGGKPEAAAKTSAAEAEAAPAETTED